MTAYLMLLHFIADFLLQSREMGKKKSSEVVWLIRHLFIQTAIFYAGLSPFLLLGVISGEKFLLLPLLNSVVHGIIDWNIWNFYKLSAHHRIMAIVKSSSEDELESAYKAAVTDWKYWEDHWFYATIGFDQLLHTVTLLILWSVL